MINNDSLKDLTICIPTYNRQNLLSKLLETIPYDFPGQVIISDNGNFLDHNFKLKYKKYKILIQEPIVSMYENWNKCIEAVKTKWFMIPSDDDILITESFNSIENSIVENFDCGIIFFGFKIVNDNDQITFEYKPIKKEYYNPPNGLLCYKYGLHWRIPSIIISTEAAKSVNLFDKKFEFAFGDLKFVNSLLLNFKSAIYPSEICNYKMWNSNFTTQFAGTVKWCKMLYKYILEVEKFFNNEKDTINKEVKNFYLKFVNELYAFEYVKAIQVTRLRKGRLAGFSILYYLPFPLGVPKIYYFQIIINLIKFRNIKIN